MRAVETVGNIVYAVSYDAGLYVFELDAAVGIEPRALGTTIFSSYPNPFSGSANLLLRVPFSGTVDIAVYDVAGRLVRDWRQSVRVNTPVVVQWDGADRHGSPVASGVYMLRMLGPEGALTTRVTCLR